MLWVFLASVGKSSATQGGCYATNDTLSSKKQQSLQVLKLQVWENNTSLKSHTHSEVGEGRGVDELSWNELWCDLPNYENFQDCSRHPYFSSPSLLFSFFLSIPSLPPSLPFCLLSPSLEDHPSLCVPQKYIQWSITSQPECAFSHWPHREWMELEFTKETLPWGPSWKHQERRSQFSLLWLTVKAPYALSCQDPSLPETKITQKQVQARGTVTHICVTAWSCRI